MQGCQVNSRTKERKNMKDPMVQAERSKYTFIDLLEKILIREGNIVWNVQYGLQWLKVITN